MRRKIATWILFAVALAALPGAAAAASCSEMVVGSILSLTGRHSTAGILTRNGYEFAIRQLKEAGGIRVGDRCYDLRVIYHDDESMPERGVQVAERLIERGRVQFLLGPNSAAVADAVSDITEAARIPMLSAQGMPRTLFARERKYLFGLVTVTEHHLAAVLELAAKVAVSTGRPKASVKIALVSSDDPYVSELRAGLLRNAIVHSMSVVVDERLAPDLTNMPTILSKVRLNQADIVIVTGDGRISAAAARQIEELQVHTPIVAMTDCEAAGIPSRSEAATANILCAARAPQRVGAGAGAPVSDYPAFEKAYRAQTKMNISQPVPDAAAQAAIAVAVFADALRRAGARDSEKIRDALAATDMSTFYGRIRFSDSGNVVAAPVIWRQIQSGRFKVVAPADKATHNFQWPRRGL
ncbi:MAG: ABC transporter substrate-binding protein [Hyphomicrobiaceae bacterium]